MTLTTMQIITTIVVIVSAVIIVILERIFPYNKNQKFFRSGFLNDFIFYNGIQSFILGFIISWIIDSIDHNTNLSRLHLISDWPIWLQVLFFVVTHDLYIYWFHRWQHKNKFLWRIHEAHHTNENIDWIAGSRSHAFEILINQTVEFAPIILLGAAPVVPLLKGL